MSLRLHYAIRSDVGHVREGNEDSAYAGPRLLAVADGMGGHAAGEVASSTVISALAELDEEFSAAELLEALTGAMHDANAQLRAMSVRDGSLEGMGTTVTALLSSGDHLGVLHVGDSRAYLLRDGVLSQVTHDHTLVQDLVDQGRITPEQATTHPQRSLLMRALDGREVEPDLSIRQALVGDRYLLCTDGLSGVVTEDTILEALLLPTPQDVVDRLVELALKGGGPDNITVVVADIVDDDEPDEDPLVAGAAAEKDTVPGAAAARTGPNPRNPEMPDSAAAKAARIGRASHRRDRDGFAADDLAEEPDRRWSGRRIMFVSATVVILVILGAAASWAWIRGQYYVGVDDNRVAVFQGVKKDVGGISLSSVYSRHQSVSDVPEPYRSQVMHGIEADSLADAQQIVRNMGSLERPPVTTPTATPTASPTTSATATTVPSVAGALATCAGTANLASVASCLPGALTPSP